MAEWLIDGEIRFAGVAEWGAGAVHLGLSGEPPD
jgi:hypothetical protein